MRVAFVLVLTAAFCQAMFGGIVVWDENSDGDLLGPGAATPILTPIGHSTIIGSLTGAEATTVPGDVDEYDNMSFSPLDIVSSVFLDSFPAVADPGAAINGTALTLHSGSGDGGAVIGSVILFPVRVGSNLLGTGTLPSTLSPGTYTFALVETTALDVQDYQLTISVVPEPSTYLLVGLGLAGVALWRRRSIARS